MAFHNDSNRPKVKQPIIEQVKEQTPDGSTAAQRDYMGFTGGLNTITAGQGSEYTRTLMEVLKKEIPTDNGYGVHLFDKTRHNLAYSSIVMTFDTNPKAKARDVYYFVVMFGATGAKPMPVSEMVAAFSSNRQNKFGRGGRSDIEIYTPSDALDEELHKVVTEQLNTDMPGATFISIDGITVPFTAESGVYLANQVWEIAHNALLAENHLQNKSADLNITAALQQSDGTWFNAAANVHTSDSAVDELGSPLATNWAIGTRLRNKATEGVVSLNARNSNDVLCTVSGSVDSIPDWKIVHNEGMAIEAVRFRAFMRINNINLTTPTPGNALLAIATAALALDKNVYIPAIANKDPALSDPGANNLLANLENNQNQVGAVISTRESSSTPAKKYDLINRLHPLNAVLGLDIDTSGPQGGYTTMFLQAAAGSLEALNAIVTTAYTLSNGAFPLDYPVSEIFMGGPVVLPKGTWESNKGTVSIDTIDLAAVINTSKDVGMANDWGNSNYPYSVTGLDSFSTRVGIIDSLNINATITGKISVVMFNPDFLTTLAHGVSTAGFDLAYEQDTVLVERSYAKVNSYLSPAGRAVDTNFTRGPELGNAFRAGSGYTSRF